MDRAARRAAITAYKERPLDWGVFAVRCQATGVVWVGESRRLASHQNAIWFTLRTGGCRNRGLQAAWVEAGEAAFSFEKLEQLPTDTPTFSRADLLKGRADDWRAALNAVAF
jgi:hypothetical protein